MIDWLIDQDWQCLWLDLDNQCDLSDGVGINLSLRFVKKWRFSQFFFLFQCQAVCQPHHWSSQWRFGSYSILFILSSWLLLLQFTRQYSRLVSDEYVNIYISRNLKLMINLEWSHWRTWRTQGTKWLASAKCFWKLFFPVLISFLQFHIGLFTFCLHKTNKT